jgi:hypothetical protein
LPRRAVIAIAVVVFLVVSFELARYLSASGNERAQVYDLLTDEARGDVAGVLGRLHDCDARCRATVTKTVPKLVHPGDVKILLLESGTAYTLGSSTGITRVAWDTLNPEGPTHVQCVTVRKHWSLLSGASTSLLRISAPIGNEASC